MKFKVRTERTAEVRICHNRRNAELTLSCVNPPVSGQRKYKCALPEPARRLTMVTTLDVIALPGEGDSVRTIAALTIVSLLLVLLLHG